MFALSMLNDEDYEDLVMPVEEYKQHQVMMY
jgi:hypothetical protein